MPGLVKIGLTTVGAQQRAISLASGLPAQFELLGVVSFPQQVSRKELYDLEQESHRRLADYRYADNREFFRVSPEQALAILNEVQQDAQTNLSRGLTPLGKPRQSRLAVMLDPKLDERSLRRRENPPVHWHVWTECVRDGQRVTALELYPRTYWSKSGASGRVKRDKASGVHSDYLLCQDSVCPDFGRRRKANPPKSTA